MQATHVTNFLVATLIMQMQKAKRTKEISFNNVSYLIQYIQDIISTCYQYNKINSVLVYILFFFFLWR
jgi:hypothetical protein